MSPEPTPRMKRLYHYLVEHRWGEPADLIVFDGSLAATPGALEAVSVGIWDPDAECDITTFATLGMSERVLPGADYRVELSLGCRSRLGSAERRQLASFVANITEYPFMYGRKLDWWEKLTNPGSIPVFRHCTQILLAPMFGDDEFRTFPEPDADVKILSVVPITPRENHILAVHGRKAFLDYWEESGVDIFSPRRDPDGEARR